MRLSIIAAAIVTTTVLVVTACREAPTRTPELDAIVSREAPPKGIAPATWSDARSFYERRQRKLAWVVASGPTERTEEALDAIHAAEAHGLDPADYHEPELREALNALQQRGEGSTERTQQLAHVDVSITCALLRLGRHVATGRRSPAAIDPRWNTRREAPDYAAALQEASRDRITSFLDRVQPQHPEYAALRRALESLRAQAADGWPAVPAAAFLEVGQWNARAVVPLRQRLAVAGYLPAGASLDSPQYDADVEEAVRRFQEHHRLAVTGVLDRATLQELNVPLERRIAQVAINLERWRWLPDDLGARHFIVNVPDYHLIARENGRPMLDIRVVVGKRGNETPLFSDALETVVFSPYWNVPDTIALEETAPAALADPDFLARNNMEVVDRRGRVVPPETIPWDDELALAAYRFRQRPGANNALGHVKFLFPNKHAVYLHDTPADALFKRIGRAFSHGCVRVEEPEALAEYVLRDQEEWTPETIRAAMRAGEERYVQLSQSIPVHILYLTAWVDGGGGLNFSRDVYGYDARQLRMK
jgi:murein L,D-transpeptidase YcbB/YkuD